MKVDLEHVVPHPLARVFAVMSDPRNRPLWQENTRDVEMITSGPPGLGTRWREHTRGVGLVEGEVIGFEPGALWAEQGIADGGTGLVTVAFAPEGDAATRLSIRVELSLRGTRRLLEPALGPMVHHQMPRDLHRLEELLRASPQDGPGVGGGAPG
jgi:uncharacterized protein YndB with AHSA1/START domain